MERVVRRCLLTGTVCNASLSEYSSAIATIRRSTASGCWSWPIGSGPTAWIAGSIGLIRRRPKAGRAGCSSNCRRHSSWSRFAPRRIGDDSTARKTPGRGLGVNWEGTLIAQAIYERRPGTQFVPILRDGLSDDVVPEPLRRFTRFAVALAIRRPLPIADRSARSRSRAVGGRQADAACFPGRGVAGRDRPLGRDGESVRSVESGSAAQVCRAAAGVAAVAGGARRRPQRQLGGRLADRKSSLLETWAERAAAERAHGEIAQRRTSGGGGTAAVRPGDHRPTRPDDGDAAPISCRSGPNAWASPVCCRWWSWTNSMRCRNGWNIGSWNVYAACWTVSSGCSARAANWTKSTGNWAARRRSTTGCS